MTANTKEEAVKLTYDDRRKILNQKKSQTTENVKDAVKDGDGNIVEKEELISTVKQSMDVDYTEAGIRLAHKNLVKSKTFLEDKSADLRKQFEGSEEMPEDLKVFKEKIEQLGKYAESEKAKSEYEDIQKELKETSKELKQLEKEIGTRLKL